MSDGRGLSLNPKQENDMEKEKKTLVGQATPEQIEAWKRQHGDIYAVECGDSICYLKKPSRKALGYASYASKTNPLNFNETILNDCWLGGDESIKTDDAKFLGVSQTLGQLIEVKEAEIKKL